MNTRQLKKIISEELYKILQEEETSDTPSEFLACAIGIILKEHPNDKNYEKAFINLFYRIAFKSGIVKKDFGPIKDKNAIDLINKAKELKTNDSEKYLYYHQIGRKWIIEYINREKY